MRRIFGAMNRRYMIRAYLIGLAFSALMMGFLVGSDHQPVSTPFLLGFLALNLLLFPFAKVAWDELRDFIMGDTVIIQSTVAHFLFKYLINGFLFTWATLIAPFGIAYLWFQTRGHAYGKQGRRSA